MSYIILRYLHFMAILVFAGALLIENMAIRSIINKDDAKNLAHVDSIYGVSAVLVLLFGLLLWFGAGKPSEFYSQNPLFHIKIGLFVLVAVLSIYPSIFMFRNRKANTDILAVPRPVILLMRLEIAVLIVIPILAVLMARGVGLSE